MLFSALSNWFLHENFCPQTWRSGHWPYKRSYISKSRPALTVCRPRPSQLPREPYRRHRLLPSQSSSRREPVSAGKMRAALWSRHRPAAAAKAKVQVTSHVCMETSLFAARKDKCSTKGEAAFAASAAGEYLQASPCNLKSVTMRQARRERARSSAEGNTDHRHEPQHQQCSKAMY